MSTAPGFATNQGVFPMNRRYRTPSRKYTSGIVGDTRVVTENVEFETIGENVDDGTSAQGPLTAAALSNRKASDGVYPTILALI